MAFTFTVEDGTGLEDSNAYVSVAYCDDYHDGRGHDYWATLTAELKQDAIVRATDHVDRAFGNRYRGVKYSGDQALLWPRSDAYDRDGYSLDEVPDPLQRAVAEYAMRAAELGELTPDPARSAGSQDYTAAPSQADSAPQASGTVKLKREKVGPLEEETEYDASKAAGGANSNWIPAYPAADLILQRVLRPAGGVHR